MDLEKIANDLRIKIIDIAYKSRSAHVGSMLSCIDILAVLYFQKMKLENWEERDIFILSKAHAELALYVTLAKRGIINNEILDGFNVNDGTLPGHLDRFSAKGVEVSAGSLGHGFNIGIGMAHGYKLKSLDRNVYCIIGDGEMQEGSIWEGAMFAPKFDLNNFTVFVDYNNQQGYGSASDICQFEPVAEKWEAFGWNVEVIDGNSISEIETALAKKNSTKPRAIIAKTIKGKGVSFMEDSLLWHYYILTDELKEKALQELTVA